MILIRSGYLISMVKKGTWRDKCARYKIETHESECCACNYNSLAWAASCTDNCPCNSVARRSDFRSHRVVVFVPLRLCVLFTLKNNHTPAARGDV